MNDFTSLAQKLAELSIDGNLSAAHFDQRLNWARLGLDENIRWSSPFDGQPDDFLSATISLVAENERGHSLLSELGIDPLFAKSANNWLEKPDVFRKALGLAPKFCGVTDRNCNARLESVREMRVGG